MKSNCLDMSVNLLPPTNQKSEPKKRGRKPKRQSEKDLLDTYYSDMGISKEKKNNNNSYVWDYDYLSNQEFWVPLSRFAQTKKIKNLILYLRQNQWSRIGNTTVFNKLDYLLNFFDHQGPMSSGLKV